jgi:hypothetical protein
LAGTAAAGAPLAAGLMARDGGAGVRPETAGRTPDGRAGCLAWRIMPHCLQRIARLTQSVGMLRVCLHPGQVACTTVDMTPDLRDPEAALDVRNVPPVRIILP